MSLRLNQLLLAAHTVTKRTPERRRRAIIRQLHKQRPSFDVTVRLYYLSIGTVPRSLWSSE